MRKEVAMDKNAARDASQPTASSTPAVGTCLSTYFTLLGRAIATEYAKLRYLSSTYIVVACALVFPIIITCVVSYLQNIASALGVMEQPVESILYWTRVLGITVFMVWGINHVTADIKYGTFDTTYLAVPRWSVVLLAKWISVGSIAGVGTLLMQPLLLWSQKVIFPTITQNWSLSDHTTITFLWAQPVLAFLSVGVAVGLGALVRSAALAISLLLVWEFVGETVVSATPKSALAYPAMPFYNAALFAGQEQQVPALWSPGWAGVYWLVLAVVLVALGVWRLRARQREV